jgi:hypothetical protein
MSPVQNVAELWQIDFDGGTRVLGAYPPPPANQNATYQAKLDGEGALFEMASDTSASFRDTIIRRTLDGGSDVVYSEGWKPLLKIHISSLVTGP